MWIFTMVNAAWEAVCDLSCRGAVTLGQPEVPLQDWQGQFCALHGFSSQKQKPSLDTVFHLTLFSYSQLFMVTYPVTARSTALSKVTSL